MNKIHISVSVSEKVLELTPEYSAHYEMLDEFADNYRLHNKKPVVSQQEKKKKYIMAGSYCGFIRLIDGSVIEILPKHDKS